MHRGMHCAGEIFHIRRKRCGLFFARAKYQAWEKRKAANDPAYFEAIATIPAGRLGEADEIADAVLFMASPAARWVYGQTLIVDGGQTLFGG